ALEAGALALAVGLLAYLLSHFVARALRWPEGHAIGLAAFAAVAIGAGIALRHLFSLFFVNPGSPAPLQLPPARLPPPARPRRRACSWPWPASTTRPALARAR